MSGCSERKQNVNCVHEVSAVKPIPNYLKVAVGIVFLQSKITGSVIKNCIYAFAHWVCQNTKYTKNRPTCHHHTHVMVYCNPSRKAYMIRKNTYICFKKNYHFLHIVTHNFCFSFFSRCAAMKPWYIKHVPELLLANLVTGPGQLSK